LNALSNRIGGLEIGAAEQRDKLIAVMTKQDVSDAQRLPRSANNVPKDFISSLSSMARVDFVQTDHVDEQQR
jgi:hypothetical protein